MAAQPDMWPGDLYELMVNGGIKYRLYPSLLDKYQTLLDYEDEAEKPWNKWTEASIERARAEYARRSATDFLPIWVDPCVGDYILTPDEYYEKLEQELIDTINREPHEPSEAADRGTSLNEVIDCMILNKPCTRDDMTIQSQKVNGETISIRVDYDGFTFNFDPALCRNLRDILRGSECQYLIQAPLQTKYGNVLLYGYMDYWRKDTIIDLKTTSRYEWGKYERKWQRYVYPYCAVESGMTQCVSDFTYLVAQLGKGSVITGRVYPETYTYSHESATGRLRSIVESFIEWMESPEVRYRIHDKKIFNQLTDIA